MRNTTKILLLVAIVLTAGIAGAQNLDLNKVPKLEYLKTAKNMASDFFQRLKEKDHEANADFIIDNLGSAWDESKRISERNDYLNKFQLISIKPPQGVYGDLDGYDLIEQGFLRGSDRYFRHTYMAYFEGNYLIFEFRFYVDGNEKVTLDYIGWSEKNPFEYMSTSDMLLPKYD
ncbi:hypothetical protein L21SP5_00894 [Salinivirga cyanobacteriivorans]|uniref:Nuclear transport factor 2 family protein n=1 Tax=Salinivirga cyanobacteriivorans TaxID=1307839 RepID=A0A0S2HX22_9BACT|nr:hypothetical protein [Salinivirga cyanobacteriivorans]ALO14562.1 hypothetical protein L21SP5_00894 [Salinivirga cyanobacteriivorans]